MGLFKSKEEKARLSNIKGLIALAMADGRIHQNEIQGIAAIASRDNVDTKEVEKIIEGKDKVKFEVPETPELKERSLIDLVTLMMIDGVITEEELVLCKAVAEEYGYRPEVVDDMVISILKQLQEGN